MKLPTY